MKILIDPITNEMSEEELSMYHKGLLRGECGGIQPKHEALARIIAMGKYKSWEAIANYIRDKEKYDNWTLRDIDKVFAIINQ